MLPQPRRQVLAAPPLAVAVAVAEQAVARAATLAQTASLPIRPPRPDPTGKTNGTDLSRADC
ncbi:exported protein of unknown function [Pseudorhizobium banfieldiae]|uniref:Uncharacterized protein n=1 Tax=Pseudorhizobium banfieldiae TaxID=1125847 RepID=L0NLL8_9HYPH|nr:exported protein of unknown function [Pseudorhizobium banfieldiae]